MWPRIVRKRFSKKTIIFVIALLLGFLLRLYLSKLSASELIWDMSGYDFYAREILAGRWAIDCCMRNTGYALFLVPVYLLFGPGNLLALRVIQILLDLSAAVLIGKTAKQLFGGRAAWFSFMIYILNPFTAAYTGLRLAESLTIFLISLTAHLITRAGFSKSKSAWTVFGFLLGTILFVKMQYLYFCFLIIALFSILVVKRLKSAVFLLLAFIGFLTASSYNLIGNYQNFNAVSLVPPYNLGSAVLYFTFYTGRYPEVDESYEYQIDPEFTKMIMEYGEAPLQNKPQIVRKYAAVTREKLFRQFPLFFTHLARNMIWIWDHDHLYTYTDPFYPKDKYPLIIYNVIVLGLGLWGITKYIGKNCRQNLSKPLVVFTGVLFFCITFFFTLVSNESRHSLPFYPLVFLWGGYGISVIHGYLKNH